MPASSQPRIIIFTGSSCPWCSRVKQYLKDKGFSFREVNVERDRDGEVTLTLVLPFIGIPASIKDYLVNSLRRAVIWLGARPKIKIAEMNQDERLDFLAMEQESWRGLG